MVRGRNAVDHARDLVERNTQAKAEYERLAPRYAVIRALLDARMKANVSQSELARRMGVSRAVVNRLESGEHSPNLDTLARAAEAMGCRIDVRFVPSEDEHAPASVGG